MSTNCIQCIKNKRTSWTDGLCDECRSHAPCDHDYQPSFNGGDTYKCTKCNKEIDMTED